jgi:hypothetical protein
VRRRRPLQERAPEHAVEDSTNNGHRNHYHQHHHQTEYEEASGDLPDLNELAAQSRYDYQQRSEIETPLPARVQDLRQKLWDKREALQVPVRPSGREIKESKPLVRALPLSGPYSLCIVGSDSSPKTLSVLRALNLNQLCQQLSLQRSRLDLLRAVS